jgi:hypothetical protein
MRARSMVSAVLAVWAASGIGAPAAAADPGGQLPPSPPFQVGVHVASGAHLGPGLIFIDPHQLSEQETTGPMIIDNLGRVVWYYPLPAGVSAANFQVQNYRGQPVLTWWQGTMGNPAFGAFAPGIGQGEDVIMDSHYRIIKVLTGSPDFIPDSHEFYLTPQGTALMTGYRNVPNVDLTTVGGSMNGTAIDSLAREVDVQTGGVLLDWSALAHVPITDSHALPLLGSSPWDFFHINSISLTPDGNLLISSRHMWALYEINRSTGDVVWTLGGRRSTFRVDAAAAFAWQHDPRFIGRDQIQLLDNQAGIPFPPAAPQSRALWLHLDYGTSSVSLVRQIIQPSGQPESQSQGSVQSLSNGGVFVGWGDAGTFSEYSVSGELLLDDTLPPPEGTVTLPNGQTVPNAWSTYRVFKQSWTGTPATPPTIAVRATSSNAWTVSAAWNGATDVARWLVLAGQGQSRLHPAASGPWDGLITPISVAGANIRFVQVVALSSSGRPLGTSDVVPTGS